MLWPVICLPVYVYVSFVSVFWSVYVCSSSSLFAFLSKSSEITFFYAMLLMLFAYVSCRLQYLQMNAVRCRAFGPRSLVLGACCLLLGPRGLGPFENQTSGCWTTPTIQPPNRTNYVCENSFISFSTIVTCPQSAILSLGPFSATSRTPIPPAVICICHPHPPDWH